MKRDERDNIEVLGGKPHRACTKGLVMRVASPPQKHNQHNDILDAAECILRSYSETNLFRPRTVSGFQENHKQQTLRRLQHSKCRWAPTFSSHDIRNRQRQHKHPELLLSDVYISYKKSRNNSPGGNTTSFFTTTLSSASRSSIDKKPPTKGLAAPEGKDSKCRFTLPFDVDKIGPLPPESHEALSSGLEGAFIFTDNAFAATKSNSSHMKALYKHSRLHDCHSDLDSHFLRPAPIRPSLRLQAEQEINQQQSDVIVHATSPVMSIPAFCSDTFAQEGLYNCTELPHRELVTRTGRNNNIYSKHSALRELHRGDPDDAFCPPCSIRQPYCEPPKRMMNK